MEGDGMHEAEMPEVGIIAGRRLALAWVVGGAALAAACTASRPAPAPAPTPVAAAPAPPETTLAALPAPRDTALVPTPAPTPPPAAPAPPQPLALDSAPPVDPTDASGRVRWIGREADRTLAPEDRTLLRTVFGIDDVRRIYIPTTTPDDVLRYAAHAPGCPDGGGPNDGQPTTRGGACRIVGVRIGLAAPRDPGETWDAFTGRVEHGGPRAWTSAGGRTAYAGLDALDPDARPAFERMIADARDAGFPVHVRETYRTPERQAAILARNDGRTTTLTSAHSLGRAVDISIGDGRVSRRSTHRTWVEFRRWVLGQQNGAFRLIGTPESTWDWPHIEYVGATSGAPLGYRTLDALVAAARACRAGASTDAEAAERCTRASPRPAEGVATMTVSDDEPVARSRRGRRHGRHGSRHSGRHESRHAGRAHGARSAGGGTHHGGTKHGSHAGSSKSSKLSKHRRRS
ncbi:hypothetical protein tb265_13840 [Gemmatimonadetes bacterium T265]|nr:hypothetical protein tb265_13840 [Gemmatimonadetes bacterium T265]